MLPTIAPFQFYVDLDGTPLDEGSVYYGVANANPVTSPIPVFWDLAGTQPAAQPIKTLNGYPVRFGTPAIVYVATTYSVSVYDKKGRLLYYAPDSSQYDRLATYISDVANQTDSAKGSALVGYKLDAPGAVGRTVYSKLSESINVLDFGAKMDGVSDDTAAIQAAANYLSSTGGEIEIPKGQLLYTTLTLAPGVNLRGASSYSSVLMQSAATGDGLIMQGDNHVSEIQFNSKVSKTSGRTVWMQGNNCTVRNFEAYNYYLFCDAQTAAAGIVIAPKLIDGNCGFPSVSAGGGVVAFTHYANAIVDGLVIAGPGVGTQPSAAITLVNGDTCVLSNTNVTRHGIALNFAPTAGLNVFATYVSNCLFDSSNSLGNVVAAGAGNVYDTSFTNTWCGLATGANGYGMNMAPSGVGVVDGLALSNVAFPSNSVAGFAATSKVTNIVINGGYASGGVNGYVFGANCSHFVIKGVRSGNVAGRGASTQNGILVAAGASDFYVIQGNDCAGNGAVGVGDNGTGVNKFVLNNLI